jgi:hypothetical protein
VLTRILAAAIVVLVAAGTWRFARWYWRPRLQLLGPPSLSPGADGIRLSIRVHNAGAGRSRRCRARLLRAERWDGSAWIRVEARARSGPETDPVSTGIRPRDSAQLLVDRALPPTAGRYRVEVAAINGEEVRASYVVEVEEADTRPLS